MTSIILFVIIIVSISVLLRICGVLIGAHDAVRKHVVDYNDVFSAARDREWEYQWLNFAHDVMEDQFSDTHIGFYPRELTENVVGSEYPITIPTQQMNELGVSPRITLVDGEGHEVELSEVVIEQNGVVYGTTENGMVVSHIDQINSSLDYDNIVAFRLMAEAAEEARSAMQAVNYAALEQARRARELYWNEALPHMRRGRGYFNDAETARRAKQLLVRNLSIGQKLTFEENQYFYVTSESGETYKITYNLMYNVSDEHDNEFCTTVPGYPIYDIMLVQKWLLENDEELFLEKANKRPSLF